jgi:hypothetical protein
MNRIVNQKTVARRGCPRALWLRLVPGAVLAGFGWLAPGMIHGQTPVSPPGPAPSAAQAPAAPGKIQFTNKQQFRLKIDLPEADRQKLKEVQLYVRGGNSDWACKETAAPNQTHFNFRAQQDGEYWFTIVTVDKAMRLTPPDVTREPPAFVVVVDTQLPEVTITEASAAPRTPSEELIRCSVKDVNLDASSVKYEYQAMDKTWRNLEPIPNQAEFFHCPEKGTWTGQVRVTASDLAKNTTVREGTVGAGAVAQATPSGGAAGVAPGMEVVPLHVDSRSDKPGQGALATGQRLVINQLHAVLDYRIDQVGPSGVGKVEVWITADEGRSWQRLCDDPDRRSPAEFDLPKEGTYGVALVVLNGYLVGDPPPAPGTVPDCWIEVDMTKPTAQLLAVRPGGGDNPWTMVISWAASDRNLGADPIDLYYSTQREGPWLLIARGLKNDGNYVWSVPHENGAQFFVRMEVSDRAGNMTRCDSPTAVVLDTSHPRATAIGLNASGPMVTPPSGSPK